jgi:hypothetical protein
VEQLAGVSLQPATIGRKAENIVALQAQKRRKDGPSLAY